ncbi:hypothetical protein SAMN05444004_102172 [Jannaschia faecimaris]|uniref:Lipoprotein n=1 Tax=Jannaschia faecimaris TaxID=1244108 RepID=A0A1H3LDM2_9RHOB|nr:hypothetical protein [Jannaschia faecimaris]SDY62667.1 hypothetical protein SAMN05444004_102172 [Jannaschia faecimaris]
MDIRFLLLVPISLTACNMAHPLDGLDRSGTASAGGHDFRVNYNLETAQATRTNPTWRPELAEVMLAAMQATEEVTGCAVKPGTALGDIALVNMSLDCRVK